MILDVVISEILKGRHDLIAPEIMAYFLEPHQTVMKAIAHNKLVNQPVLGDAIKTRLASYGLRDHMFSTCCHIVDEAERSGYIAPDDIKSACFEFYAGNLRTKLISKLQDKNTTAEIFREELFKAAKDLEQTSIVSDIESYEKMRNEHLQEADSGAEPILLQKSIEVKNKALSRIFGNRILPQLQLVLGRPNDGKSTLVHNLEYDFYNSGVRGIHVSLEDSKRVYMGKMLAIEADINKKDAMFGKIEKWQSDKIQRIDGKKILMMDRSRKPSTLFYDLKSAVYLYNIKWVVVDFIQEIEPERWQKENEAITEAARMLKEISTQFEIPVIMVSQAPKADVGVKTKLLGTGNEYGSAALANLSRSSWSINPHPDGIADSRIVSRYKTSYMPHGDYMACFDFSTGRIKSSDEWSS